MYEVAVLIIVYQTHIYIRSIHVYIICSKYEVINRFVFQLFRHVNFIVGTLAWTLLEAH